MTRFLMSLEESVQLVNWAFKNADSGDIFVQKSPASTVETIAQALCKIADYKENIDIIGTRHGEKLYESLVSREELMRSVEVESFYQIKSDSRDLNYDKYFTSGDLELSDFDDYNSHNTERLNLQKTIKKLLELPLVRELQV